MTKTIQRHLWLLPVVLLLSALGNAADEGILNRLLAPGPLIIGHKDLEGSDCLKCHDAGKGVPDSRCLDCHKEIRPFIEQKKGFHGLATGSCISCHKEHKGREYDSAAVNEQEFDHGTTGYRLEGKHGELKCSECHSEKRGSKRVRPKGTRYFGAQASCISCHKKDDHHQFPSDWAKKDCISCHGLKSWKTDIKFNHEKDAKYKLEGKHATISCKECHTPKGKSPIYRWPDRKQKQCLSCHQDIHAGKISEKFRGGGKCVSCHNQNEWKIPRFDHERMTSYSVKGAHLQLKCTDCHKQAPEALRIGKKAFRWSGLGTSCKSCHSDVHKSNLSEKQSIKQCDSCHGIVTWKIPSFDHERITRYAIDGGHMKLKCTDCHKQTASVMTAGKKHYKWAGLQSSCRTCHEDVHKNNMSPAFRTKQCESCHVTTGWKSSKFDHAAVTRFPLRGAHAKLACTDCHKQTPAAIQAGNKHYKWTGLKKYCLSCHGDEHRFADFRSKKLPQPLNCASCHDEVKWKPTPSWDHDRNTRYAIDGKHLKLNCLECHAGGKKEKARARGTYFWPDLQSKTCETCHTSPHRASGGAFNSKKCSECHITTGWKIMLQGLGQGFDHDKNSRFPLTGKHRGLKCDDCHLVNSKRVYKFGNPEGQFCASCHENVHAEQFSSDFRNRSCAECHTTNDFVTRYKFDHDQSRFKLREKHLTLKCGECHVPTRSVLKTKPGKPQVIASKFSFPELSKKNCETCHKDPHRGSFGNSCSDCHNERAWKATRDFHKNFTLTGVHYTLSCNECHKNDRRLAGLSSKCMACHQKDDVHRGSLPNCGECHRQHFWENADYRHSLTLFPLRGTHRTLDCNECHANGIYKGLRSSCVDCHRADALAASTPHTLPAMNECSQCHNQFTF